ncbi:DNA repair protein RecN (Recombination protein N) [Scopulibacillus daqui]|uniref:DNA repair protein RecN n=1 Tax=Scopulibacillus daqui TaxID=1469162 RepID=A0ABS2Q281_9BACL|nr:DNA repair protein RecN [Scopulibacillus daqui]MBM7646313.1 DNA repair protein RecN (Recombination protein N) [Scopulibacillus daqui]
MLIECRVENFAIIEKLNISFEQGLTVFTGETGAGKSIIIDAISLLIGGRGSAEYVRHGAKKAEIEALFEINDTHPALSALEDLGIECPDQMIVIRRQISETGKSVCRINGKLVTLSHLKEVGQKLVDIHGQHEHQELMHPEKHIGLLDRFGGEQLQKLKKQYQDCYTETQHIYKQIQKLNKNEQQLAQRIDLLKYQIKEITEANLKDNEEEELLEERKQLVNFEKLYQSMQISYEALYGENKGLDFIRQAVNHLESIQELDANIKAISNAVSNSFYILEENAFALREHLEQLEYQPERLNMIETRLSEIGLLKKKYGQTVKDILEYLKSIEKEYQDLSNHDQTIGELEKKLAKQLDILKDKATKLSLKRRRIAADLSKAINRELKDLHMGKAVFEVKITTPDQLDDFNFYHIQGIDEVEFLISTNPGEPLKALAKIASGGEMSRIMLAIKSNFKSLVGLTSIIFDEVDTGVSGRVAQAMAEKIYQLSHASQVFCITHLPQVAAMADQHLYISKEVSNKRTATKVKTLDDKEKIAEIGRMISGVEMTDLTKKHAEELLKLAKEIKS